MLDEYDEAIGWTNGKTRFWSGAADSKDKNKTHRTGGVGFHHCAFELHSRKDVDELHSFVKKLGAEIVDPPDEYYENYYAAFSSIPLGSSLKA